MENFILAQPVLIHKEAGRGQRGVLEDVYLVFLSKVFTLFVLHSSSYERKDLVDEDVFVYGWYPAFVSSGSAVMNCLT